MKMSKIDRPFILRVHLLSDFAAPMIGTRQQNMIRRGIIDRNSNDTTAKTIDMNSFARGSNW
jgi:hypothetical protein